MKFTRKDEIQSNAREKGKKLEWRMEETDRPTMIHGRYQCICHSISFYTLIRSTLFWCFYFLSCFLDRSLSIIVTTSCEYHLSSSPLLLILCCLSFLARDKMLIQSVPFLSWPTMALQYANSNGNMLIYSSCALFPSFTFTNFYLAQA